MTPLEQAIDDYIALRQSLGFKLREYAQCLRELVSFLERRGAAYITTKLALEYACLRSDEKPVSWGRRLGIVRGFARYRVGDDPRTEIPSLGLLRFRSLRAQPYIYTANEIHRLLIAALTMKSPHPLRQRTHYCLFGLLAVTGLRLSEALNLTDEDVNLNEGMLTIRKTKFDKSRLVPLHPSTRAVLRKYVEHRKRVYTLRGRAGTFFFATIHGTRLNNSGVNLVFRALSREIGLRQRGERHGPRLHDFRHRFAVQTLLRWYRHGDDADRQMSVLSTYLGHGSVTGTYWYLTNTPELMAVASARLEQRWKGVA